MRSTPTRRVIGAGLAIAFAAIACATEQHVHPPPEGEWLEWKPKKKDAPKKKEAATFIDEPAAGKGKKGKGDELDDPGAKGKTSTKSKPPPVTCSGQDVVKEAFCVAQTELGAVECPDKLPKTPNSKNAGVLEAPPKNTKRDPSIEESAKQCCYAWCVKAPSIAFEALTCKKPEVAAPLFCFEAPASGTKTPATGQYGECPAGLKKTAGKGSKRSIPLAAFNPKETKDERASSPKACCYETCKKP